MTLLIMAAGIGSRYGGVKQIDPVGQHGELIIDYTVYDAILAGFDRVIFVISKAIEKDFCEAVFDRIKSKIKAEYVFQNLDDVPAGFSVPESRVKPWGTGHASLAARKVIKEPFVVVNADEFYGRLAYQKMARFLQSLPTDSKGQYAFVTVKLENAVSEHGTVSRGICEIDKERNVTEINERLKVFKRGDRIGYTLDGTDFYPLRSDAEVNVNFAGFTPDVWPLLWQRFEKFIESKGANTDAEFGLPQSISALMRQQKIILKTLGTCDDWLSTTYKNDKSVIQDAIAEKVRRGEYPSPLWKTRPRRG